MTEFVIEEFFPKELAKSLKETQYAILQRLNETEMIEKQGNWVSFKLNGQIST